MPSKKRAFIDRSRARTYEIVYRPLSDRTGGSERVLRAVPRGNASDPTVPDAGGDGDTFAYVAPAKREKDVGGSGLVAQGMDVAAWEEEYARKKTSYELGEYGLPDDGYDYGKHFKVIGGTGAVFVSKSGETNGDGGVEAERVGSSERVGEDERKKEQLREKMEKERREDPELDEVLAALEASSSEDETEDEAEVEEIGGLGEEGEGSRKAPDFVSNSHGLPDTETDSETDLEDEFISLAQGSVAPKNSVTLSSESPRIAGGVRRTLGDGPSRKSRLLDDQFDELMARYEEDDECPEDFDDEEDACSGDQGSDEASESDDSEFNGELDNSLLEELAADLPEGVARADNDIDRAMDALVGEYKRATIEETYSGPNSVRAPEALAGVRKAAAEHFRPDENGNSADPVVQDSAGNTLAADGTFANLSECEDDGQVSDAADVADGYEIVESKAGEKWDCETILSTYSNLDNHPSVIDDDLGHRRRNARRREPIIRLDPRTNAPVDYMPSSGRGLTRGVPNDDAWSADGSIDEGVLPRTMVAAAHVPVRDKKEGKEEKRQRKERAKAAARLRRQEKKETKRAYASEFQKQDQHGSKLGKSKVSVRF